MIPMRPKPCGDWRGTGRPLRFRDREATRVGANLWPAWSASTTSATASRSYARRLESGARFHVARDTDERIFAVVNALLLVVAPDQRVIDVRIDPIAADRRQHEGGQRLDVLPVQRRGSVRLQCLPVGLQRIDGERVSADQT